MSCEDSTTSCRASSEASERIAANLVELEIDSSRQLLEVSTLKGGRPTAGRAASATLTELWRWQGLLKAVLERAGKLRGPWRSNSSGAARRPVDRADQIGGPAGGARSAGQRGDDGPLHRRRSCSCACPARSTRSRRSWRGSGTAWERVGSARARGAVALRRGAGARGAARRIRPPRSRRGRARGRAPGDLGQRGPALDRSRRVDGLIESLQRDPPRPRRRRPRSGASSMRGSPTRAPCSASSRPTAGEGRAAHEEVVVKISVPPAPGPCAPQDDLERSGRDRFARPLGAWRDARHKLDAWTSRTSALLDDARQVVRANRAPIEARNQFRALLEAYQVKARRLGIVEDPRARADLRPRARGRCTPRRPTWRSSPSWSAATRS